MAIQKIRRSYRENAQNKKYKRARHGRQRPEDLVVEIPVRYWRCYFNFHTFERPADETPEDCPVCGHPVSEIKV